MTTKSLEYKWITEVHKNVQDFWFFTKQDGARSTFANWAFQLFHFTVRAQVCSLARWLSHMGAPLLDYFPPSDGNLSPLEKISSPCFSSALFCPQFCTGDFASKGSFPLLILALCKLWQPRCRALTQARKKCGIVISYELRGITTIFGPQYWIQVCFQKKIVFFSTKIWVK